MLITTEIIARKYATAYFKQYHHEFSDASIMQLRTIFNFCHTQKTLFSYLTIPTLALDIKSRIIEIIAHKLAIDVSFKKLLFILIKERRLELTCPIIKHIIRLYQTKFGILEVHINSSHPLDNEEEKNIIAFIRKKTGAQQILPNFTINPILISGLRIYTDTWLWESSVHQLLKTATFSVLRQVES